MTWFGKVCRWCNVSGIVLAALLAVPGGAMGMGMSVDIMPNFFGLGGGVTTEWSGSRDTMGGVVPGMRYTWDNNRFVEWYALYAGVNLIDSGGWELGPAVVFRLGRKDVKDPVVKLLPEIGTACDLGMFGGYTFVNRGKIPFRVRTGILASTTVFGGYGGTNITPYASAWLPLSSRVFVGMGLGVTWANSSYMNTFYGVSPSSSAVSGLPAYSPGAGVRQVYAWPALLCRVTDKWYVGAGAFYQRLTGGASDSPIVDQRGDANQWTYGVGVGYGW